MADHLGEKHISAMALGHVAVAPDADRTSLQLRNIGMTLSASVHLLVPDVEVLDREAIIHRASEKTRGSTKF